MMSPRMKRGEGLEMRLGKREAEAESDRSREETKLVRDRDLMVEVVPHVVEVVVAIVAIVVIVEVHEEGVAIIVVEVVAFVGDEASEEEVVVEVEGEEEAEEEVGEEVEEEALVEVVAVEEEAVEEVDEEVVENFKLQEQALAEKHHCSESIWCSCSWFNRFRVRWSTEFPTLRREIKL